MRKIRLGVTSVSVLACCVIAFAQQAGTPAPAAGGAQGRGGAVDPAAARQGGPRGGARGGRAGATQRKRVLAWADTRNGQAQHDSVGHALATIERLGYESGMWDTFIRTDSNIIATAPKKTDGTPASGGPSLANVDAIFFEGHREVPLEASQKEELLAFVRAGHGFVAAHVGLTSFESWPEFGELIGARFDGHPITGPGVVINEDPNFPATRHFPAAFNFSDEFYQPKEFSRDKIDVLLRLDVKPGDSRAHPDGDYPLAWAKMYGQGRVFFGSFAHASATWDIRDVQQMYFQAMMWALGLTDGTPTPHPMRGSAADLAPARGGGGGQR
jgi:type 1 glutamine amidotransferase